MKCDRYVTNLEQVGIMETWEEWLEKKDVEILIKKEKPTTNKINPQKYQLKWCQIY